MREKIWKIIKYKCGYNEATDQILTLITEEIEKVENPYIGQSWDARDAFADAKKKILGLFK